MKFEKTNNLGLIEIERWEDYIFLCKNLDRWIFRGQSYYNWDLVTSLERVLIERRIRRWKASELFILSDFQKAAHFVLTEVPKKEALIEWFSLIQHYGGPTRLLDFTESFYIASFFALQNALSDSAVWALNRGKMMHNISSTFDTLTQRYHLVNSSESNRLDKLLKYVVYGKINENKILTVSPVKKNIRQYHQRGISIFPLSLKTGVMNCIKQMFGFEDEFPSGSNLQEESIDNINDQLDDLYILKIVLKRDCHLIGKMDLSNMNINYFSLYGGVEGLALHLRDSLNSVEAYEIMEAEE